MDSDVRISLTKLKELTLDSCDSEIRPWLRELLVQNVRDLLEKDASHSEVQQKLIGGFHAIYDAESLSEDHPVILQMQEICNSISD